MADHEYTEEEFKAMLQEARILGLEYIGSDPVELQAHLNLMRVRDPALHPVRCYGVEYDGTSSECRACQLEAQCNEATPGDHIKVPIRDTKKLACDACGVGELSAELRDPDSDRVRDFGCSNPSCGNRLSIQCGFVDMENQQTVDALIPLRGAGETQLLSKEYQKQATIRSLQAIEDEKERQERRKEEREAAAKERAEAIKRAALEAQQRVEQAKADIKSKREEHKDTETAIKIKVAKKGHGKGKPEDKIEINAVGDVLSYEYDGEIYTSLDQVTWAISGGKKTDGKKFFKIEPQALTIGEILSRKYYGKVITVEVKGE